MAHLKPKVTYLDQFALEGHGLHGQQAPADLDVFAHLRQRLGPGDALLPRQGVPVRADAEHHPLGGQFVQ